MGHTLTTPQTAKTLTELLPKAQLQFTRFCHRPCKKRGEPTCLKTIAMFDSSHAAHNATLLAPMTHRQDLQNPRENGRFSRFDSHWHAQCISRFVRSGIGFISLIALLCVQAQAGKKPQIAEFPFEYREGMIWLEVQTAKSTKPLNFLLDSGAGVSAINLSTAQRLELRRANRVEVQGVGSSTTGYFPQRLSASITGFALPKQYVAVDLDELSSACHCRVDGLVGADFFRDRIVQIDFESHKVRILDSYAPRPAEEILPLKKNRSAFLAPVTVNGKERQWLRVDTGCASALHWAATAEPADNRSRRVAIALNEISVDTIAAKVRLGKIQIPSVSAELHEHPLFSGEDGLLGNGVLSRFRSVTIDARAGRIAFQSAGSH